MSPDTPNQPTPNQPTPATSLAVVPWWRHAVVYQVYPRSFADGNGDGTGDLAGVRSRLGYLRDLGVDAIWFNPWYPSPLRDGGYDVADYRAIDPRYGTLADAESLIEDAHQHGLRTIVDIVPNHTSSEHVWFQAALTAPAGSPERNRYIFREGKGADGSEPPTNWNSVFGGPAWSRLNDGWWYLHLFDWSQPDLNWDNEEVRAEFDDVFRFWLRRGVDGFRIDVAHGMVKDPTYPDVSVDTDLLGSHRGEDGHPFWDRDDVHEINRRWRAVLDSEQALLGRDVMMVAEAWVPPDRLPLYLRHDEYHQSFNFDFLETDWDANAARAAIVRATSAAAAVGSTPTWTLSNHDVMRHATRYGLPFGTNWRTWPVTGPHSELDPALGRRRAAAATLLLLALPGSTYLYQGEELGLPEVWDLPPEVLDDPVWESSGHTQKGRDGCRVPLPWTRTGASFGFGEGAPWLPQPTSFGELSVESQTGDPDSMLSLYRSALAERRDHLTDDERIEMIDIGSDASADIVAFRRGSGVASITNFGTTDIALDAVFEAVFDAVQGSGKILIASDPDVAISRLIRPNTTVWLR
ncbi:MAG TPA: glycoside hydrolase family 13 protein [Ilumatobacter sp.]|nr:glycoside hydrolase family 13 protein [Ilumatobacter sp.]